MIDLKKAYQDARNKAVELMQQGRINAYIAQLARVNELQLQLINYAHVAK